MDTPETPAPPPVPLDVTATDLHGEIRRLRAQGAIVRVALPGDLPAWVVTRHSLLQDLLADERIAKDPRHWSALTERTVPDGWPLIDFVRNPGMTTADGEDHRRLRTLVTQSFTPRRVAAMRPRVEADVHTLLDELDGLGTPRSRPVDLRRHFAYPLAMRSIGGLLGVPAERYDTFRTLSASLVSSTTGPEEVLATRRAMQTLLGELVNAKRERPGEDIISDLIAAGDRLSPAELIGTLVLMLVAGHGTTMNLITNAVRALLTHPDQLAAVRAGSVPWTAVVEETLRWDSPVAHFPLRYATEDIPLAGTVIRRGEAILASYAAAGRDPDQHGPGADEFDANRAPTRHLAFGHGPHYCLGAAMARQEAEVALPALFQRFPGLELAVTPEELVPLPSFISNSVLELPVRLGQGAPAAP
ncbi:cytochrome P450 family protein [Streptomyces orinoci]|uniref:Cytochrome P450 n=1 Tax=Streptomyces orinoci TaxID=67339 RepID=A0ABV3JY99_STRON|nr:cytochrome P450 [Streptomyces orinoci]